MALKPREKMLAIMVGVCAGLYFGDMFIVEPLIGLWDSNNKDIAQLHQQIDKANVVLAQERSLNDKWREMTQRSLLADRSMAANQVLTAIQRWQTESHLGITSIQPNWKLPKKGDTQTEYEVHVTGQGDLTSIMHFLFDLEMDSLALNISECSINTSDPNGRNLTVSLRFTGLQIQSGKASTPAPGNGKVALKVNTVASAQGRVSS